MKLHLHVLCEAAWHLKVKDALVKSVCCVTESAVCSLILSSQSYTVLPAGCRSKFHCSVSSPFTEASPPFPADPLSNSAAEGAQPLSAPLTIISYRAAVPPAHGVVQRTKTVENRREQQQSLRAALPVSIFCPVHCSSPAFLQPARHQSAPVSVKLV
jgi:hypothetical protein